MPEGPATTIRVSLFLGGPGTNFDFFTFSFQVPRKGSVWAISDPMKKKVKTNTEPILKDFVTVASFTPSPSPPLRLFLIGRFDDGQIRSDPQIDEQLDLVFDLKETNYENRRQRLFR